jgi:hypothetical protein
MVFLICMLFLSVLFEGWCIVSFLIVDDLLFLLFCVFPIVVAPVFVSVLLLVLHCQTEKIVYNYYKHIGMSNYKLTVAN